MKEFRTAYLRDVVELIDEKNPHTITVRDKEYVQVVRCKDCIEYLYCEQNEHNDPDGFCAWGKPREVEE